MADFDVGRWRHAMSTMGEAAGAAAWYKVIDLMHYCHVHLTSPVRGYMVWDKDVWALALYREPASVNSDRSWERFKQHCRRERLFTSLPGDEDELPSYISGRVVIRVQQVQDAVYAALGPPHLGGLSEQVRCESENLERLLPVVVRGIAAAARAEQQRRKVG